jgi:nucleoid-associated protein YgaU
MLTLDRICNSYSTCGVSYAEMSSHRWQLTAVTVSTVDRKPVTNEAKHADAVLTFVVDVDDRLTGSARRKPKSDKGKVKHGTTTVRKGETLAKIAVRVYGNANRAADLAKLNKIRNPRSIRVGQKIRY